MAARLHDLSLAELRSLSRQLGGPDTYKRTELFGFLLDHYDYDDDDPLRKLYRTADRAAGDRRR